VARGLLAQRVVIYQCFNDVCFAWFHQGRPSGILRCFFFASLLTDTKGFPSVAMLPGPDGSCQVSMLLLALSWSGESFTELRGCTGQVGGVEGRLVGI